MRTTTLESRCPACHTQLDGATDVRGEATPKPGDLSVCSYCSVVCIFNTDLTVRAARPDELDALPTSVRTELEIHRRLVQLFNASKGNE